MSWSRLPRGDRSSTGGSSTSGPTTVRYPGRPCAPFARRRDVRDDQDAVQATLDLLAAADMRVKPEGPGVLDEILVDAPAAPHDVALELFKSGVHIRWEDASDDEDSFIVERWARSAATLQYDGSGKLSAGLARPSEGQTFGVHFVELVELPENTEDYFDDDVDAGLTYAYRIRAVNDAGSSLSEEVEITVP